jgi:hypothetical protein
MAVVIAALLPVFLLIVLGFILKRSLMRLETQWHGLERLTYYVLFPTLLIQTLVKDDLDQGAGRRCRRRASAFENPLIWPVQSGSPSTSYISRCPVTGMR